MSRLLDITEPMTAARGFDPDKPKHRKMLEDMLPVYASFKIDGVRATAIGGVLLGRSMKPIRNKHTQSMFRNLEGLDGELVCGRPNSHDLCRNTSSAINSIGGTPDVRWFVFDHTSEGGYSQRRKAMLAVCAKAMSPVVVLKQHLCSSVEEVLELEKEALKKGYEGLIIRSANGLYKSGRSTIKEGYLLKLKRFKDAEAEVIGFVELMHNLNEQEVSETGRTKRSHKKEGMVGGGTLGALKVRDLETGQEFEVGTGFSADDRQWWWNNRHTLEKTIITYKYFPQGVKDKPRHPVYKCIRHPEDMPVTKKTEKKEAMPWRSSRS
jgi:DNA ligase-1